MIIILSLFIHLFICKLKLTYNIELSEAWMYSNRLLDNSPPFLEDFNQRIKVCFSQLLDTRSMIKDVRWLKRERKREREREREREKVQWTKCMKEQKRIRGLYRRRRKFLKRGMPNVFRDFLRVEDKGGKSRCNEVSRVRGL